MDFTIHPDLEALRRRVAGFVAEHIMPREADVIAEDQRREYNTLLSLQQRARDEGLWTPHLPVEFGGLGQGVMGMCVLFREMGRSPVGARVFNCDAPDQGNMDLLLTSASPTMREKWLRPLCEGRITSAFCMTEPAPGAGADPSNLATAARQEGNEWVINGHKWYSTGGQDASFLIVMARTSDDPKTGASMFIVNRHAPGVEFIRNIPTMGPEILAHREAEFRFHGVRVGEEAVLGRIGEGFSLAQKRLVPARLTHCMRWLGLASRALELCKSYISTRTSFGKLLAQHQSIQQMIAKNALAIHSGNLMTFHCAWMLEQGMAREARPYSSMAKLHVARTLCDVLDDAIQMHGGLGYSDDMPFGLWYRHARSARIADGPDEVHVMLIAREFLMKELRLLW
ncbi:MAG: (R)-benzylsuccinyl-CoA dehydrogenase [Myxococcota bacterium]|nr:(R)-benzylsuccinyl-CoA dehydrogenase [Myxococcota bacterium]